MPITLNPVVTINGTVVTGDKITVKSSDVVALAWTSSNADEVFYSFGMGEYAGGKVSKPGGYTSTIPTSRKIYLRAISVGVPEVRFEVDVTVSDAVPVSPNPTPMPAKEVFATLYKDGTWVKA